MENSVNRHGKVMEFCYQNSVGTMSRLLLETETTKHSLINSQQVTLHRKQQYRTRSRKFLMKLHVTGRIIGASAV